jgi:hypothetical protein
MEFDNLVTFIKTQWPVILAVAVIIGPPTWLITRGLYENRLKELSAEIRRLRAEANDAGLADSSREQETLGGAAQGEWLQVRMEADATYMYRMSLMQAGQSIRGTASVTRTGGRDSYEQPFNASGLEFSGLVILMLTSSDRTSTSAAAALLRMAERGAKLEGQWAYRARRAEEVLTEPVSLVRQPATHAVSSPSG